MFQSSVGTNENVLSGNWDSEIVGFSMMVYYADQSIFWVRGSHIQRVESVGNQVQRLSW